MDQLDLISEIAWTERLVPLVRGLSDGHTEFFDNYGASKFVIEGMHPETALQQLTILLAVLPERTPEGLAQALRKLVARDAVNIFVCRDIINQVDMHRIETLRQVVRLLGEGVSHNEIAKLLTLQRTKTVALVDSFLGVTEARDRWLQDTTYVYVWESPNGRGVAAKLIQKHGVAHNKAYEYVKNAKIVVEEMVRLG